MDKNKKRNEMNGEKVIDLLWEVKEGKKHPNKAYKELCVLFNVSNCECKNLPKGEIAISSKALTDPNWKC